MNRPVQVPASNSNVRKANAEKVVGHIAQARAGESSLGEVRRAVDELLRTLDDGRYRFEEVHVRADLNYLRALTDTAVPYRPAENIEDVEFGQVLPELHVRVVETYRAALAETDPA